MLAFEHPHHHHQQQNWADSFVSESSFSGQEPYPGITMDAYASFEPTQPFSHYTYSIYENPSLLVEAPHDNFSSMYHRAAPFNDAHKPTQQPTELPPSALSSTSGRSIPSAASSTVGSPYSGPAHTISHQETWINNNSGLGLGPAIVNAEGYIHGFVSTDIDSEMQYQTHSKLSEDFVDPSLIQGPRSSYEVSGAYSEHAIFPAIPTHFQPVSTTGSPGASIHEEHFSSYPTNHLSPSFSPQQTYTRQTVQPQSPQLQQQRPFYIDRRSSVSSLRSKHSHDSPMSGNGDYDEDGKQRGRCPNPECGRVFKDLKAHMLTHQLERPEKCPIVNCEYNQKGFARKYDRNRHTLTHYKGTMVCGFCPGSGSAIEKSFNRADVFKRHLTSVHGVEQTAPNSRKRSPNGTAKSLSSYCQDATGKCSTCSSTFSNAQDFYEHLDDCVLRVVQQEEPSEAINQQRLAEVAADDDVKETMERHMLTRASDAIITGEDELDDDDDEDDEDQDQDDEDDMAYNSRSGKGAIRTKQAPAGARAVIGSCISKPGRQGRKGLTYSKGGVPLVGKGRKKRKHYPTSWGLSADKMQMKKRVLCVYDGQRRLWKDDLMMHNEFEVRMKLADGKSYVTDLDVETLKRAEALHHATEEERGPWNPDDALPFDLEELMAV